MFYRYKKHISIAVLIFPCFLSSCSKPKETLYDKKIAEHKEAIKTNPDDVEARYNLGVNYGRKGLFDNAIEQYNEALRINPDFAEAHYNLGLMYSKNIFFLLTQEIRSPVTLLRYHSANKLHTFPKISLWLETTPLRVFPHPHK